MTNSSGTDSSASSATFAAASEPGSQDRLAKAVRAAEQALIEFEIAVETFRVEVENFSRLHHQRLGPMYARLDELDALVAEAVAAHSGEREDIERAWEARELVMPMPGIEELFGGLLGGALVDGVGLAWALGTCGAAYFVVTMFPAVDRRWRAIDKQPARAAEKAVAAH